MTRSGYFQTILNYCRTFISLHAGSIFFLFFCACVEVHPESSHALVRQLQPCFQRPEYLVSVVIARQFSKNFVSG
jgi:hypothetical protein